MEFNGIQSNKGYVYKDVIYTSYSDLMGELWVEFGEDFEEVEVEQVKLRYPYYENFIKRNIDLDDLSSSLKAFMYSEVGDEYYNDLDVRNVFDNYEPKKLANVLERAIRDICPGIVIVDYTYGMIIISYSEYCDYWDDSE